MKTEHCKDRDGIIEAVGQETRPVILAGADGTGKSYIAQQLYMQKHVFKFCRKSALMWTSGWEDFKVVEDCFDLYDRHPVIDWPVYQAAYEGWDVPQTIEEIHSWVHSAKVQETLRGKTVVFLNRQYTAPSVERGDPETVIQNAMCIRRAYLIFYKALEALPKGRDIRIIWEDEQ